MQEDDFDVGAEIAALTDGNPTVGGLCTFVGMVRDMIHDADGRTRVRALVLEHYPGMTERELARIEAEARCRWPLESVLIIHRFGRLEPGARIVLVAVASAHRDAAFEACRFLIDWLKTKAPFWKREETDEGDRWVEARASDDAAAARWEGRDAGRAARKENAGGRHRPGATASDPDAQERSMMTMTDHDEIDVVFLDFDGVIAESVDIKARAFRSMYQEFGEHVVEAVVAHHKSHGGVSRRQKIRHYHSTLLGIDLSKDELERLADRFSELVEEEVVASEEVPGAGDFLNRHHDDLDLFVVSATPQDELRRVVARRGLARHFRDVRGSPPEKGRLVRDLLDEHDLEPGRVLFVGDSMTDYDAAVSNGLRFVGRVPAGQSSPFPTGTSVVSDLSQLVL